MVSKRREAHREGFDFEEKQPPMTKNEPDPSKAMLEDARSHLIEDIANLKSRFNSEYSGRKSPHSSFIDKNKYSNLSTLHQNIHTEFSDIFNQPVLDKNILRSPTKLPNVTPDKSGLVLDN